MLWCFGASPAAQGQDVGEIVGGADPRQPHQEEAAQAAEAVLPPRGAVPQRQAEAGQQEEGGDLHLAAQVHPAVRHVPHVVEQLVMTHVRKWIVQIIYHSQ